jgi:Mannosylglycerate hydrolase MGH1-like glycoside hydrolase domain/Glycosyl hydrolase family 63 C-terminal domain
LWGVPNTSAYVKDAFHDYVTGNRHEAVNPARVGTKAAAHYRHQIGAGESATVCLRLADAAPTRDPFGKPFDAMFNQRAHEADEFYARFSPKTISDDARRVMRQAFAGLLWGKQFYHLDVKRWLDGDPPEPPPPAIRKAGRDHEWTHLYNEDVISMPDKWEYPWYAAWDLAFHMIPLAMIDPEFAKSQLILFLREWFMHPNGQIPAYEWAFGDVNPPVHAWAVWRVYKIDRRVTGVADRLFLERAFQKLLLNFTWWVNRKDAEGKNVFQGGFLGLDNIGVFDRSAPLPGGGHLEQSDGTSWMAMYCLNMLRIALELSLHNPTYQDIATKFFEHFLGIAEAMTNMGEAGSEIDLWDDGDEFYYDHLNVSANVATPYAHYANRIVPLRVRSIIGLIPMFAVETLEPEALTRLPGFARRLNWYLAYRPDLTALVSRWNEPGRGDRRLLSLLRGHRLKCLLRRMLDEEEFLSPYGVRSLSRHHRDQPYVLRVNQDVLTVAYVPGESDSDMFGGNSNWRGPIWLPINFLLVESLRKFHHYYGDDFKVECPTRSGKYLTLAEIADELTRRLGRLFLKNERGERPAHGGSAAMQHDPHFRDMVWFYEHFHGDTGRGVGANHQTGWTALIANLLTPWQRTAVCDPMYGCS